MLSHSFARFVEPGARIDAGVIHQHIKAAKLIQCGLHRGLESLFQGDARTESGGPPCCRISLTSVH
jgi:hypothetical protein